MTPHHIVKDLVLYGIDFPSHTMELGQGLATLLGVSCKQLDGSMESLCLLDEHIMNSEARERSGIDWLRPAEFSAVLGYVGTVVVQATGGNWEMILADDGCTWEPWIAARDDSRGGAYQWFPVFRIFDVLFESHLEGKALSLALAVELLLRYPYKQPYERAS